MPAWWRWRAGVWTRTASSPGTWRGALRSAGLGCGVGSGLSHRSYIDCLSCAWVQVSIFTREMSPLQVQTIANACLPPSTLLPIVALALPVLIPLFARTQPVRQQERGILTLVLVDPGAQHPRTPLLVSGQPVAGLPRHEQVLRLGHWFRPVQLHTQYARLARNRGILTNASHAHTHKHTHTHIQTHTHIHIHTHSSIHLQLVGLVAMATRGGVGVCMEGWPIPRYSCRQLILGSMS